MTMEDGQGWNGKSWVRMLVGVGLLGLLAQGCTSDRGVVPVEANELGVAHVQIEHSAIDGERLLVVRGLDEGGEEIALVTLRTGTVSYTSEPGLMPEERSQGTELVV